MTLKSQYRTDGAIHLNDDFRECAVWRSFFNSERSSLAPPASGAVNLGSFLIKEKAHKQNWKLGCPSRPAHSAARRSGGHALAPPRIVTAQRSLQRSRWLFG